MKKLRWIYLGLVVALAVATVVYQLLGSTEVASHSFNHLLFAAVFGAVVWFIRRPVSTPNLWLWRGAWGLSAAQFIDAVGAFGYDDRATSAVPGLQFVHNSVAWIVLFAAFITVVASALTLAWKRLPRTAALGVAVVVTGLVAFMIITAFGLSS